MRQLIPLACGIALIGPASIAAAQESADERTERAAEFALSDGTLEVRFLSGTTVVDQDGEWSAAVFLSEERDIVGSAALLLDTDLSLEPLGLPQLVIRFGPQAYAVLLNEESNDALGLAFGVRARLEIDRRRGIAIVGNAYYSPDVLTFGSADNVVDFMARGQINLSDRVTGFAGYRWFELDLIDGTTGTLQDEAFVGIRWQLD